MFLGIFGVLLKLFYLFQDTIVALENVSQIVWLKQTTEIK
jgi:hypothetical protein